MRKLTALLMALLLMLTLAAPALSETVEAGADAAVEAAAEAAADTAETAEAAEEEAAEEVEAKVDGPSLKKFGEQPWYIWVLVVILLAVGIALAVSSKTTKWNSHMISMGAMCLAIAFVLSCIRLFRMPQSGSVTPAAILPLVLFAVACGPGPGLVVGCAYGLLDLISGFTFVHPIQLLVDYPLAYAMVALACLATKLPRGWRLPVAALLACVGRYLMAVFSGAVFFAEYAGEQNAWVYSLVYNLTYMGPNTLVCVLVACIPGMERIVDMIRGKQK